MNGKICLVTGATSGIGKAVAAGFARRGAKVVIVARDSAKAQTAARDIKAQTGVAVDWLAADLSSQESIRRLAEAFRSQYPNLHVLVNNAAVFTDKRLVTGDGLEMMFATNHLAYFLLTNLLLDTLKASAPASIFNVTAPSTAQPNFDDLQGEQKFSPMSAFGVSKMDNLLFTFALARRLEGSGVNVNAYHPGLTRSNLMHQAPPLMKVLGGLMNLFVATPDKAAAGLVELAASNANGANGQFFHGTNTMNPPAAALNQQTQERLWTESERLVKTSASKS
jgi:NAD(P)-dependent dehydrogenase (short-subunit alcohol dehydrogenase family)